MSEKPTNPPRKFETHNPAADSRPVDDPNIDLFADNVPATDDSPTVISKNHPKPASGELATDNLRGRVLAHFELLEPIGVGGMAAVLRARDTQLDRVVALKILPPEMAKDPENVKRFQQEARSAAKLDHENIARVFFCGEDQRLHFIAFEFVEGDNLRTIIERRGRLPVAEAVHYVLQVAAGLAHAVRRGVVHRDIKPSNIIVTPTGRAKLVDMGLARSLEPQKDMHLTQSGVTLGTFDYISPEQALEPREADVRSDIYSLGCTLYHMLTGQPPVPEGTAAKKLNHHQHIKPIDPRQLVPDLPDDVVGILDRMMAKQPKDRYQTPEHLVHELLVAARKLGSALEVSEGVLSVEASVPSPARRRPVLLAALAVAAVVGLVLLLQEPASSPLAKMVSKRVPSAAAATDLDSAKVPADPPEEAPQDRPNKADPAIRIPPGPPPETAADTKAVFPNPNNPTQGLAQWAQENTDKERLEITLSHDVELKIQESEAGLRLTATNEIVLKAKDPSRRPTIRLIYAGATVDKEANKRTPWAALTFEAKKCEVQNVRVLLDCGGSDAHLIGLHFLRGVNSVRGCEFIQAQPGPPDVSHLASVVVETTSPNSSLELAECCFLGYRDLNFNKPVAAAGIDTIKLARLDGGGHDAVIRRGSARITAVNCAFSPHAVAFRLEQRTAAPPSLRLEHCTLALGSHSAAIQLDSHASAEIDASHCLFAGTGEPSDAGPVLIRQVDMPGADRGTRFAGLDNRYFNLAAYWPGINVRASSWEEFRAQFEQSSSLGELADSPWLGEGPQAKLDNLRLAFQADLGRQRNDSVLRREEEKRLRDGFQVKTRDRALRPSDSPDDVKSHLIGVEQMLDFSYVDMLPDLTEPKSEPSARKTSVVSPDEKPDPSNGRYESLSQALSFVKPGEVEVILIRKNGPLVLEQPIRIEKAETDVTLKAANGFRPILTLAEPNDAVASLFAIYDGKLHLEDLEFRLRPAPKYHAQSVVALFGGQCTFKDCQVTLDRAGTDVALSLALLPERAKEMMKAEGKPPTLELVNCLVRGDGDLIVGRGSRPFDLKVSNTLAVLGGALLNLEADPDGPPVSPSGQAVLALSRLTAYLSGPLIRLQAGKDLKGLVPLVCKPVECLFVPGAAKPLVQFEAGDTRALRERLFWTPGTNVYGSYMDMVSFPARSEDTNAAPPLNQQQWKEFTGETTSRFQVKFNGGSLPFEAGAYQGAVPTQFKVLDVAGFGADLTSLRAPAADK